MSFNAPNFLLPSPPLAGYKLVEQLYLGTRTIVYRAIEDATQRPVILKFLRQEYPSFYDLLQFRNQYTIAKKLNIPGVVRPYHLETWGNSYALVMEDFRGTSLREYGREYGLSLVEILAIAIQLAEILHELGQQCIIHKDIKPANILIQPESKQVQLIDFSTASFLQFETQEIQSLNRLEGTLAYLAPEQTGRMNRGIDYRSDFYALGVSLYELLTGQLPFQSADPLELVYCHLAKSAVSPHEVNSEIPAIVSEIVLKLMAKNAEDRYQSALGLKFDLEQCLEQLKTTGKIHGFELGQRDVSDRFTIPEKLYGRDVEVQALLDTFDRVAKGRSELLLIVGCSGIGKTAVVNEVHRSIVQQRGYFTKGKFDQFQRDIPFFAFVQALRDLMRQLLNENNVAEWQAKILQAVGENGQILIDVIPELEQVIGAQPAVLELSGTAAENRFNLLFQKFIQVFTTIDHPFVLFLDDLQWADSASLKLLKLLMNEASSEYLLVLGAYRDQEVFAVHPLMITLEEISRSTIQTLKLLPLSKETVNQFVADTLSCSCELAAPLTQLIYQNTQGNPFFTTRFLKALHEEGAIQFQSGHWQCDLNAVRQLSLTDNVVEFMALQVQKLPAKAQQILQLAACIGNQFDLETLAIVAEQSDVEAASNLWSALQAGLVLPIGENYRFSQGEGETDRTSVVRYQFVHDRVQQAVYSLISDGQKQAIHLRIGQFLLRQTEDLDDKIFAIVSQFNLGIEQVRSETERETLARLNLDAARKARLCAAYVASAQYCQLASQFAGAVWERQPDFALELYIEMTQAAYLTGAFEQVDRAVEVICQQTCDPLEQVKAVDIQIQSLVARSQLSQAIQVGQSILQQLGVELPEQPNSEMMKVALDLIREQMAEIENVVDLPLMQDAAKLAAMKILSTMASAAYIGSPALYPLIVLKQVELSLEFGNAIDSPYAFVTYGLILCAYADDVVAGNQGANIGLALMEKLQANAFKAKILNLVSTFCRIWQQHPKECLGPLKEGFQAGVESGDLEFAAYSAYNYCQLAYIAGSNLFQLKAEMQQYGEVIAKLKQDTALNFHQIQHQAVLNWLGENNCPQNLIGSLYDETTRFAQHQESGDAFSIGLFYSYKLALTYHFGLPQEALAIAQIAETYISSTIGTAKYSKFFFYHALTLLANWQGSEDEQNALARDVDRLNHWAVHAPMNFEHRCDLIQAEVCRVSGNKRDAIEFYDRAISGAKSNHYPQEEALANELAAQFYLDWGKEKVAAGYLQEAYYCYSRWGAKAKVNHLADRYPHLLAVILQAGQSDHLEGTLTSSSNQSSASRGMSLDFAAGMRAAQAISSEIELEKLLATLLKIAIVNAGAETGALVIAPDWMVVASGDQNQVSTVQTLLDHCKDLPRTLIHSVARSQETAVFDDLSREKQPDRYVVIHQPKSVLCTPILSQGKLIGILYLENNLTVGAFTSDRVETLQFLTAQAAISIENARLYEQMENYSQTLEVEVARKTEDLSQKAIALETTLQNLQQTQAQLIQSEKMSALGQLVAGVAHEINNPVSFIHGNLDHTERYVSDLLSLLKLYQQEYPQQTSAIQAKVEEVDLEFVEVDLIEMVRSMKLGSDRIRDIVLSLRNFSRLDESGMKAVNLHEGIESSLLILQNRFADCLQVTKDYGNLPKIVCYASEMNQVFFHVIGNALDAIASVPAPLIRIQTEMLNEKWVRITISDNGVGIPDGVYQQIFNPFFTTKPVGSGTGLGLSVSYSIIKKHGGRLTYNSTLGRGTEFLIEIPIQN